MSFPREARYILDWSPACGLSYYNFLHNKQYEQTATIAIPVDMLPLLASEDTLSGLGIVESGHQGYPGYRLFTRNLASIEQSVQLGAADLATVLRWNMTNLAIGMPAMFAEVQEAAAGMNAPAEGSTLTFEMFRKARSSYIQGNFREAMNLAQQAQSSQDLNPAGPQDFRLSFLIGRLRIGSWFGPHKNDLRDIVDPEKAETAFLDAARILRHSPGEHSTDVAHATLWAARAAYICGDLARAIGNTNVGLGMLTPADKGLHDAAVYQYAKYLCTRGEGEDYRHAEEALVSLTKNNVPLLIEAASDPQFNVRKNFLEEILTRENIQIREEFLKRHAELSDWVRKLEGFKFGGNSASQLLRDEIQEMSHNRDAAAVLSRGCGLLDLDHATRITAEVIPKPGYMFSLFRTRFNAQCHKEWENMAVTHAAKSAEEHLRHCEEVHKKAEAFYRKHGGFNRTGGQDKLGYAVICSLLTIYMIAAMRSLGGQAIIFAIVFMITAAWFYWAYFRIHFGLVDGYDAWRKAKSDLEHARTGLDRRATAASKAWKTFQTSIDDLGNMKSPF